MTPKAGRGGGIPASDMVPVFISYFNLEDAGEGNTARDQAMEIILDYPMKAAALYQQLTGGETGVTDLERRSTEAGIALNEANARSIIAWDEGSTYEQMRQRLLDKIDQERWGEEQAITEFNAWMDAAIEARHRGETVYGEQMERAAMTTPTEYYPGTEPGGARERFAEKYGVEYTSTPGIAVETLPDPEQMYSKWHQNMGISQQAPPTQGGWSGQGMDQAPRWNAAQDFLQRAGLTAGVR